jgi:hypothetical protein
MALIKSEALIINGGDPVSRTYYCPYFHYEKEGIICEAGKVGPELRDSYISDYCASMNYRHCTLARALELQYETGVRPVRRKKKAKSRR